jgi:transposase, IS5 family
MITDRYDPMNLFELVPKLGLEMDAVLVGLDRLLDDEGLFQRVKADLARRYPNSLRLGRHSTPVEVILRMLVVRRLYDWSYEATEHFVSDSLVLRQFCRLYIEPAPDDTTLIRWAALIGSETLEQINERVVFLARQLRVTRGRKLRTDGTVVETNIAYPQDSNLLRDGVRVLSRLVGQAKPLVTAGLVAGVAGAGELFRNRTRSATRLARRIAEAARRRGEEAEAHRQAAYRRLLKVAEASLRQAETVQAALSETKAASGERLSRRLSHFVPLLKQVIRQTQRRVLDGEAVPALEKIVSLFEPHSQIIRRGKVGKPTEFGRKVWLDEVDGGIVSSYRVLDGNPPEDREVAPSIANHQRLFEHPPDLFAADRGVHSAGNESTLQQAGVKQVALPQPGAKSAERQTYERQGWFRRAMRFRAGIEGRISVLKRRGYLGRCRDHGEDGFGRWVGWGVITANLSTIARATAAR